LAAALGLAVWLAGRGPPADQGLTRPRAVRTTPFEQRDLRVLGLRIRYVDEGPRQPPEPGHRPPVVVLIPGHTSRVEEYDGLVPVLSARHRVLVLDFPGSGYAEKPDREYSLALYEDTLVAMLDALGVERAHLAGGSLGGNLVLRLGHRFPDRFERLPPRAPGRAWVADPGVGRAPPAIRRPPPLLAARVSPARVRHLPEWP